MACAFPGMDSLKEIFECPVCMEEFRDPRILSCGHHFCLRCVEGITDKLPRGHAPCPKCRAVTAMEKATDLPRPLEMNELQKKLLSGEKQTELSNTKYCEMCDSRAVMYCLDCKDNLCHKCTSDHVKFTGFERHKIVELSKIRFCDTHTTRIVTSFCETCNVIICAICAMKSHKVCSVVNVNIGSKILTAASPKENHADKGSEIVGSSSITPHQGSVVGADETYGTRSSTSSNDNREDDLGKRSVRPKDTKVPSRGPTPRKQYPVAQKSNLPPSIMSFSIDLYIWLWMVRRYSAHLEKMWEKYQVQCLAARQGSHMFVRVYPLTGVDISKEREDDIRTDLESYIGTAEQKGVFGKELPAHLNVEELSFSHPDKKVFGCTDGEGAWFVVGTNKVELDMFYDCIVDTRPPVSVKVILTCCDSAYPFTAVVPYPVMYMYIYLPCVAVMLDRWSNSPVTVYRHAHNFSSSVKSYFLLVHLYAILNE